MAMNAAELSEIVKDVPREAWPDALRLEPHVWHVQSAEPGVWVSLSAQNAALLFEASMMRWLTTHTDGETNGEVTVYCNDDRSRNWVLLFRDGCGPPHKDFVKRIEDKPSLVEALADACKAVAKENHDGV